MSNRIESNGDVPSGAKPPDDAPMSMEELLGRIEKDWKLHMKDRAVMRLLTAMAMLSAGTAQAMKTADQALQVAQVALSNSDKKEGE